jgi:hypothetical protein
MPRRTLTLDGSLLAADTGARTLTYRLLPFGEPGRTNLGTVTVTAGAVTIPDPAAVVLNMEHDPLRPVGRASALVETAAGIDATFAVADTTAGRDLLAEAAAGLRTGVSVELADVVIRDGRLVAGALTGAGAVVAPAFPSALLVASDTPDDDDTETPDGDPAVEDPDDDADAVDDQGETTVTDSTAVLASAPAAAPAALVATATPQAPALTLPRVSRLLAAAGGGDRSPELLAALSDITHTAAAETEPPQFIQEVWSGVQYERQIVPLVAPGTLTAMKVTGWRWKVPPAGADYAGDKVAVTSNAAETEPVEFAAARWAGAHDVDRSFVDFTVPGFWESYWQAMAASYASWSDGKALAAIKAGATAVVPDGTGVVAAIVKAALAVIPHGTPNYCLLGATAFAEIVERDPLAFLSGTVSLSSGDGQVGGLAFRTHPGLAATDVIVGTRNAATWYELGSAPIRVEAVNVANGGVDVGAFGYGVLGIHAATGIAKTTVTPATP